MSDIQDYLRRKAAELGLERGDKLAEVQAYLDSQYPGLCRAATLNNGVLKVVTPNASMASELRMHQVVLMRRFSQLEITRLIIQVSSN